MGKTKVQINWKKKRKERSGADYEKHNCSKDT